MEDATVTKKGLKIAIFFWVIFTILIIATCFTTSLSTFPISSGDIPVYSKNHNAEFIVYSSISGDSCVTNTNMLLVLDNGKVIDTIIYDVLKSKNLLKNHITFGEDKNLTRVTLKDNNIFYHKPIWNGLTKDEVLNMLPNARVMNYDELLEKIFAK